MRPHESWFGACLAEAWSLGGEPARARTLAQRALDLAREIELPWVAGVALRALGRAALGLRDIAAPEGALREALTAFGAIPSGVCGPRGRGSTSASSPWRGATGSQRSPTSVRRGPKPCTSDSLR